jgi:16S rRNA (guanine527-N7)-methyltransferase
MTPQEKTLALDIDAILAKYDGDGLLDSYLDALVAENAKINLVSRETSAEDLRRLAAESLLPLEYLRGAVDSYLDIGSGGGFPAIPILLALHPSSRACLVERTLKKAASLKGILRSLELHALVFETTYEETEFEGRFDLITLRLVSLSRPLLRQIYRDLKPGGYFVYYNTTDVRIDSFEGQSYSYSSPQSSVVKGFTIFRKSHG